MRREVHHGLVYKLAPADEKMRKLTNARKLWNAVLNVVPVMVLKIVKEAL